MAPEDMHTAGLRLCLEGTSWFSRCQQLQATGTADFREHLWPAWRMDVSGYAYTYKTLKTLRNESTKKKKKLQVRVENMARLSTSGTLSLRWGGGGGAGWRGGSPTPLSDFRNMGHCVDRSPSLRVVQVPRVL